MTTSFDFDAWAALAAQDPAKFEAQRKQALMRLAEQAPASSREKLIRLVNELCAPQSGSPLERAVSAQNRMAQSLIQMQRAWIDMGLQAGAPEVTPTSTVAEFTELKVVDRAAP